MPLDESRWRRLQGAIAAAGLGVAAFVAVCGVHILDITRTGWLATGDPGWHLMGWSFFRRGDWFLPPGRNPSYGLEIASSIAYSDSIPLLALPLKVFRGVVEVPQYFGLWLLTCFVLQAVFAWLLLGHAIRDPAPRLLGAGILLFAPAFLWRLHGHYALNAQWLVLGALYLSTGSTAGTIRRPAAWAALMGTAASVHIYLLVMTIPLWAADLLGQTGRDRRWRSAFLEMSLVGGTVLFVLWLVGFFTVSANDMKSGGYGDHALDLLGFVNPLGGWSLALPSLPVANAATEGNSVFLGLGGLLVVGAGAAAATTKPSLLRPLLGFVPLIAALLALLGFALSHRIGIGEAVRLTLPLPAPLLDLCGHFRGSVRMAWPGYYALLALALVLIVRRWNRKTSNALLATALILQAIDTSGAWRSIRARNNTASAEWPTPMRSEFWGAAAARYRRVRLLPPSGLPAPPYWVHVAHYASEHGMSTDAVALARVDSRKLYRARAASRTSLKTGRFDADTLYVATESDVGAVALAVDPSTALLAEVDGIVVLAPGWTRSMPRPPGVRELDPHRLLRLRPVALGTPISLRIGGPHSKAVGLPQGWSEPELGGRWTEDFGATLMIALPSDTPERLEVRLLGQGFVIPRLPQQHVRISVGGESLAEWLFTASSPEWRRLEIDRRAATLRPDGTLVLPLDLELPDAARPVDLGVNFDSRLLAYHLEQIEVLPVPSRRSPGGGEGRN